MDTALIDRPAGHILEFACRRVGLAAHSARLVHAHSNIVYVLERERVVVRISDTDNRGLRARASVAIARWLADQGLAVTEPARDEVVEIAGATVTFWRYYPQPDRSRPPARELGAILRDLHGLSDPPFELPRYRPLDGLAQVLDAGPRTLPESDRRWLDERRTLLLGQYDGLESRLGIGMVHGDAYPGNTIWDEDRGLLGDWDEVAIAPRELDLVNIYQGGVRFGHSATELHEFGLAYGWDVREWVGFEVLRQIRDLHTLTSYIRRAEAGDLAAAAELCHRMRSLRDPRSADVRWHAVA
ncbi:phosphotransferase [Nocardia pseudobrasiliensis]|uniref:Phosphotransferase family enzyme n=1 Tax=Nocardia pseudobrasiliensis TaxID=45979 RepID=A0A370I3Q7_9NOCA|nr:phosphotransferase [Nocardia pseudobrasiliensis]RDI65363.1 phosphotransferase family enzyme [Nocardia pseudobrasiliensis]